MFCGENDINRLRIPPEHRIETLFRPRHVVCWLPRGDFQRLLYLPVREGAVLGVDPPPLGAVALGAIAHLVLDDAARATKLSQGVEITKRRHVRISGIVTRLAAPGAGVVCRLGRGNERGECAQKHELRPAPLRRNAEVEPGRLARGRYRLGEETVASVDPGRRKNARVTPIEQCLDLVFRPAHRCGGRNDLRPNPRLPNLAGRELIDSSLVKPGNCPERSCDEMQLVLNNQIGRIELPTAVERAAAASRFGGAIKSNFFLEPIHMPEKRAGFAHPRQTRKLIDSCDEKGR